MAARPMALRRLLGVGRRSCARVGARETAAGWRDLLSDVSCLRRTDPAAAPSGGILSARVSMVPTPVSRGPNTYQAAGRLFGREYAVNPQHNVRYGVGAARAGFWAICSDCTHPKVDADHSSMHGPPSTSKELPRVANTDNRRSNALASCCCLLASASGKP